ncbi:MAG: heparan-alpha-glucosaminide N-acetyltransferase domain-containing protein [Candidatus Binatia bacterium]
MLSLDAFRGITIAGMILVNNAGDWSHVFSPLQLAAWNGWTLADLIFPFFLFLIGVAMSFSLMGYLDQTVVREKEHKIRNARVSRCGRMQCA